jgi:DNA-binding response OmpR family regulator
LATLKDRLNTPRRILCVDDDLLVLERVKDALGAAGLEVETLREPTLVVPRARALLPNLILLDRNMPILSGPEVLRSLRAFPDTRAIPVAFLTGTCTEEDVLRVLRLGAVDVLVKPFVDDHVPRLLRLMELNPASPRDAKPPSLWETVKAVYRRNLRAGTLVLNTGTPFEGRIEFRHGEFVSAEYGTLDGEVAANEMIHVEEGTWTFEEDVQDVSEDASMDTPGFVPLDPQEPTQPEVALDTLRYQPKVLILDEDEHRRVALAERLEKADFEVTMPTHGQDSESRSFTGAFDLIVTELDRSGMDGWGLLRRVKDDHRSRETSVVFLDVPDPFRQTLQAAQAGAAAYLSKGASVDELVAICLQTTDCRRAFAHQLALGVRNISLELRGLGPLWILRRLAAFSATCTLQVRDDWGAYRVHVAGGRLLEASTSTSRRLATGMAAVAALLVSKNASGSLTVTPDNTLPAEPRGTVMEEVLAQATAALNRLEEHVTDRWLSSATGFVIDEILYDLYQHLANERHLSLARAVCEQRVQPADLAARVALPPPEVNEILKDLLRRRVIEFATDS